MASAKSLLILENENVSIGDPKDRAVALLPISASSLLGASTYGRQTVIELPVRLALNSAIIKGPSYDEPFIMVTPRRVELLLPG